ncbi:uncharacterized protein LOC105693357 isoform X1 [Athalia rosae]|uniref:uncharacterized protein LOC105693357 isoform X1 n=1 Tax=Athalia rosae TaxID=37344 RepID=UPI0020339090|nr:uncharacterized protein LOC105693357 isoform X1 [Athalia rosae]
MFSLPAKSVVKNVGRRYYRKTTKAVLLDKKKPRIPVTPIPEVIEQNAEKRVSYSPSSSKQNVLTIKKASAKEESLTVNLPDVPHKFLTAEKNNISFNRRGKNFPVVAFSPGMMGICKQGTEVRSGMTDNEPVKVLGEMGPSSDSTKSYSYSRTYLESRCLDLVEHYRATRCSTAESVPHFNMKEKFKKKRRKQLNHIPGGKSRPAKKLPTQFTEIRAKRIRTAANCKSSRRFLPIPSKRNVIPAILSDRKPTLLHNFSTKFSSRISCDLSENLGANNTGSEPSKKCEPSQGRCIETGFKRSKKSTSSSEKSPKNLPAYDARGERKKKEILISHRDIAHR